MLSNSNKMLSNSNKMLSNSKEMLYNSNKMLYNSNKMLSNSNKMLQIEEAVYHRKFLGERYENNLNDLIDAEEKLKEFKEEHNIISVESQTKAAIESAAALKNQILINEVHKGVVSTKLKSDHPDVIGIEDELNALKNKLYEIEYGTTQTKDSKDNLFPISIYFCIFLLG